MFIHKNLNLSKTNKTHLPSKYPALSYSPWIINIMKKAKEWNPNRLEALRNAAYLMTSSTEVIFNLLTSI